MEHSVSAFLSSGPHPGGDLTKAPNAVSLKTVSLEKRCRFKAVSLESGVSGLGWRHSIPCLDRPDSRFDGKQGFMSSSTTSLTLGVGYFLALGVTLWNTVGAASPIMWGVTAMVGLMPPLVMMVMAQSPAKTVAQIIRDVEVEGSL